ncbi:hypothetical protein H257_05906 [Aphanomyces astaci]|uniref:Uncharacterized protein n=1 Tax=Aphanomyces astaci TaxID=112090 RepID=W4GQS2_APHAT|nr:hypothetical protein H257_05906 [Aphanomyces astaci]ETV81369.1 hypothetical protein H257_05906 [Aphanomyces astaci]|eukprot:XP_009829227.1 hypothetical protein H257_05906 [Aphanomyces astaci]
MHFVRHRFGRRRRKFHMHVGVSRRGLRMFFQRWFGGGTWGGRDHPSRLRIRQEQDDAKADGVADPNAKPNQRRHGLVQAYEIVGPKPFVECRVSNPRQARKQCRPQDHELEARALGEVFIEGKLDEQHANIRQVHNVRSPLGGLGRVVEETPVHESYKQARRHGHVEERVEGPVGMVRIVGSDPPPHLVDDGRAKVDRLEGKVPVCVVHEVEPVGRMHLNAPHHDEEATRRDTEQHKPPVRCAERHLEVMGRVAGMLVDPIRTDDAN